MTGTEEPNPYFIKKIFLALILFNSFQYGMSQTMTIQDTIITDLLRKMENHEEIDRDAAVKYLHLDSIFFQENTGIHSDSSLTIGNHIFWFIKYAAVVNCEHMRLIDYDLASGVFRNRIKLKSICDFDPSGDHTGQTDFKIRGRVLYVYDNSYRIKNEDLVLDKKKSRFSAYRLPDFTIIFKGKPLQ